MLLTSTALLPDSRIFERTGSARTSKRANIAITTSSSISVNALFLNKFWGIS